MVVVREELWLLKKDEETDKQKEAKISLHAFTVCVLHIPCHVSKQCLIYTYFEQYKCSIGTNLN